MKKNRNLIIAFCSLLAAMLVAFGQLLFVLMPIYGLVGEIGTSGEDLSEADRKLKHAENLSDVLNVIMAIFLTVFVIFIAMEVVRSLKNKKHGQ